MSDNTELKRAASEAKNWGGEVGEGRWYTAECFKRPYFSIPDAEFIAACEPGAVLALIAENERLAGDEQESADLCDCLSGLLRNTAIEVRGPEEPLKRHGFHDLPSRVKTVVAERDRIRAEVAGLRTGYEAYERVNSELKAENERIERNRDMWKGQVERQAEELAALRKDAERYRMVRGIASISASRRYLVIKRRPVNGFSSSTARDFDASIDAALGQGEQS